MDDQVIRTYCSFCGVGCPARVRVGEGQRVVSLEADPVHPRGGLICPKGRAAPAVHDHRHRVNYPAKRTRPKLDSDPGWERCSWDEALDLVAANLSRIRSESGPQAVTFGRGTGSGTGLAPTEPWVQRLAVAFGSPNYLTNTHVCNWARDGASHYTFGSYPWPAPDVERSGCVVVWGANPSVTQIDLAAAISAARVTGARLIVVDPRRVGLGAKADLLLQVRPGTDGALALALINLLLLEDAYDAPFVREWTNAPLLVRTDTGRLLWSDDVVEPVGGAPEASGFLAWERRPDRLVRYLPSLRRYDPAPGDLVLRGTIRVRLRDGRTVGCRPVLDLLAEEADRYPPDVTSRITGVPVGAIRSALDLMVANRPVALHVWNGIVQHANATQTARAIEILYALLGDWDRPGGNVVPAPFTTAPLTGRLRLGADADALRLGREDRPLGPPAGPPGNIAAFDLFTAILEARPYEIRGMLSFGGNVLLSSADPVRGRSALQQLEFFAQAELFETPTSRFADVILPAASFLETDHLMITRGGEAQARRRAVAPLYERRSDIEVIFQLAERLGLGHHFADGSVTKAYDEALAPAGLSWTLLRDRPHGERVAPPVEYEKHAAMDGFGPHGFATPSGKVELFVDAFAAFGHPPLPRYEEPLESPTRTPARARHFPLILTNAKVPRYLHSQHRGVSPLRRKSPDPTLQLHPDTAAACGVGDGDWAVVETARAQVRTRVAVTTAIAPGVVCASHGWWEACEELGLAALDPFAEEGANVNLLVDDTARDPVSGAVALRALLCRVRPAGSPSLLPASDIEL